jgi:hypothetical protein
MATCARQSPAAAATQAWHGRELLAAWEEVLHGFPTARLSPEERGRCHHFLSKTVPSEEKKRKEKKKSIAIAVRALQG